MEKSDQKSYFGMVQLRVIFFLGALYFFFFFLHQNGCCVTGSLAKAVRETSMENPDSVEMVAQNPL